MLYMERRRFHLPAIRIIATNVLINLVLVATILALPPPVAVIQFLQDFPHPTILLAPPHMNLTPGPLMEVSAALPTASTRHTRQPGSASFTFIFIHVHDTVAPARRCSWRRLRLWHGI